MLKLQKVACQRLKNNMVLFFMDVNSENTIIVDYYVSVDGHVKKEVIHPLTML